MKSIGSEAGVDMEVKDDLDLSGSESCVAAVFGILIVHESMIGRRSFCEDVLFVRAYLRVRA